MLRVLLPVLFMVSCATIPKSENGATPPPVVEKAPEVTPSPEAAKPEVAPPPPAPVVTQPAKYPTVGWISEYDSLIKSLVTENMLTLPDAKMTKFCDVWGSLDREQRKQFYADLLYSITYPESGYNNLSMYIEDTQGIDSTTGLPTVSEGLLQLSYKDVRGYPACEFNAKKDLAALKDDMTITVKVEQKDANGNVVLGPDGKPVLVDKKVIRQKGGFKSKHPERSTLNPYKNLSCGVYIVDKLSKRDGEFADIMGKYWSVMQRGKSSYSKVWKKMKERKTPCK